MGYWRRAVIFARHSGELSATRYEPSRQEPTSLVMLNTRPDPRAALSRASSGQGSTVP